MNKKILIRYGLLCLPFMTGCVFYWLSIFNIYSSLLFFVGGYVVIKNLCDYRKIRRNIDFIKNKEDNLVNGYKDVSLDSDCKRRNVNYHNIDNISGIKRVRIHKRVRRRY